MELFEKSKFLFGLIFMIFLLSWIIKYFIKAISEVIIYWQIYKDGKNKIKIISDKGLRKIKKKDLKEIGWKYHYLKDFAIYLVDDNIFDNKIWEKKDNEEFYDLKDLENIDKEILDIKYLSFYLWRMNCIISYYIPIDRFLKTIFTIFCSIFFIPIIILIIKEFLLL